jgi:hypothetical protein
LREYEISRPCAESRKAAAAAISSANGASNRCRIACLPAAVMVCRLRLQRVAMSSRDALAVTR